MLQQGTSQTEYLETGEVWAGPIGACCILYTGKRPAEDEQSREELFSI